MKNYNRIQITGYIFLVTYVTLELVLGDLFINIQNGDIRTIFIFSCFVIVSFMILYNYFSKDKE